VTRGKLLLRRSAAQRGLLALVVVLVAAVAAALGTTLGSVQAAAVDGARQSVAQAGSAGGSLTVITRAAVEDPGAADAQDARVRAVVDELLPGVPLSVTREVVPDPVDDDSPFARWTIAPDADRLEPNDLAVLATNTERLRPVLRDDDAVAVRGLVVEGGLGGTAVAAHEALRAASAVTLVPVVLLALIALVALVQVARLLATTREPEVGLLVSRGGSPRQVAAASVAEAVVAAVLAGVLGTGGAMGLLSVLGSSQRVTVPAVVGVGVAVVAVGVLGVVAGLQVRASARRQVTDRSGRARQAAALGTVLLTVVLAAVCLLQLRRYGSPLVVTPDGVRTDPLGAAAPALVLAALAVGAMALLGPLSRGWAALAARGTGATAVLAARQVARRLVVFVVPVVLLVLAAGTATLAGTYAATSQQLRTDVAVLRNGADVRVTLPDEGPLATDLPPAQATAYAALPGAAAAAPVLSLTATVDSEPVAVTGIGTDALHEVVRTPPGTVDTAAVASALAAEPYDQIPVVPAGATELTLSASGSVMVDESADLGSEPPVGVTITEPGDVGPAVLAQAEEGAGVDLRLWLAAPDGTLTLVDAGRFDYDLDGDGDGERPLGARKTNFEVPVPLPDGAAGWRLAGADFLVTGPDIPLEVELTIDAMTAATPDGPQPVDIGTSWASASETGSASLELAVADDAIGAAVHTSQRTSARVRLVPGDGAPAPVPAAVTAPLAERFGLAAGDSLELTVSGVPVPAAVAAVVDVVPGELQRHAAVMDLAALDATLLRTLRDVPRAQQVWVAAEDPASVGQVAQRAAAVEGDRSTVTTSVPSSRDIDAAAPVRSTFALAAAGAAVLALVGVAAVAVAMLRTRRHEVVVLRAAGVPPTHQGGGRALELIVVGSVAIVAGIGGGLLVAQLVVSGLAGATLTGVAAVPDVALRLDAWGAAAPVLVLFIGLAGTALTVGARVAAQARDTEYREEVR
jgi:ABC-type lipoprotein release transport system permease subunit